MKKNRKKMMLGIILCMVVVFIIWRVIRANSFIPNDLKTVTTPITYSENDKVMKAISLSYFVYGCENAKEKLGSVSTILNNNELGIIIENFGLKRKIKNDATTTAFDTSEFIRKYVGEYRFLTDLTDKESGFYGAAFCDDEYKCIWITYSGTVTFTDVIACAELVLVPGLSRQEAKAFEFMQTVMESDEVKNQSYGIIITGHSLGGALATEVALISDCEAITINGADGIAVDKISGICGKKFNENHVSNYMTSPKNGKTSFLDIVQRLMFIGSYKSVNYHIYAENGYTNDPHCAFSFIEFDNDAFRLPEG